MTYCTVLEDSKRLGLDDKSTVNQTKRKMKQNDQDRDDYSTNEADCSICIIRQKRWTLSTWTISFSFLFSVQPILRPLLCSSALSTLLSRQSLNGGCHVPSVEADSNSSPISSSKSSSNSKRRRWNWRENQNDATNSRRMVVCYRYSWFPRFLTANQLKQANRQTIIGYRTNEK